MARLLLVRHGETERKSSERLWGQTDVKLNELGLMQAQRLRHRIAKEEVSTVYASSLLRALVTAQTIAAQHQLTVIPCPELGEINFGEVEGLTYEEVRQLHPDFAQLRLKLGTSFKYPGGESLDDLNQRVGTFVSRLTHHKDNETLLVVAHAGVLRVLICQLMGVGLEFMRRLRIDLASLSIIETYPQGAIMNLLNDTSHLRDDISP